MEPTQVAEKFGKPTLQIAVVVLAIDLFFVVSVGKSPAYIAPTALLQDYTLTLGYFAIIVLLAGFAIFITLSMIAAILNWLAYRILLAPILRIRAMRVALKLRRRQEYLDLDKVQKFAADTENRDLIELVNKRSKLGSPIQSVYPMLIFVLTILIALNSDPTSPNMFMKVCSISEPVVPCGSYRLVLAVVFFQALFLMAIYGLLLSDSQYFPRKELPVSEDRMRKHSHKTVIDNLEHASRRWLRGPSNDDD